MSDVFTGERVPVGRPLYEGRVSAGASPGGEEVADDATDIFTPSTDTDSVAVVTDPADLTKWEKQQKSWLQKSQARVNPDRILSAIIALVLVITVMAASFIFSFTAIYEAAEWTGQPQWVWIFAPIYIDGAILAYTTARVLQRWRGEPGKWSMTFLFLYTALSVAVNFAHVASYWEWSFSEPESWFGIAIACAAPIAALGTAEQIIHLIFKRPGKKKRGFLARIFDRFNDPDSDRTEPDRKPVVDPADVFDPDDIPKPAETRQAGAGAPETASLVLPAGEAETEPQKPVQRAEDPVGLRGFHETLGVSKSEE